MNECTKDDPCRKCEQVIRAQEGPPSAASEMATACTFTNGSLECINDPCPNPNHRTLGTRE